MNAVFRKNRKKGFTLVELIVTFALLSIFLAACSVSLSSFLKVYGRVNDVESARLLSDTLMETISGSLGGAAKLLNNSVTLTDGTASYTDSKGYNMSIMLGTEGENDGRVVLQYKSMEDENASAFDDVNWAYKGGVYRDNQVTALAFEKLEDSNCIKVSLAVENIVTGFAFETAHIVECYNLEPGDIS